MSGEYQFGLHILFIVAIVQFTLGAAAVWLFGGLSQRTETPPALDPAEFEVLREKHREDQRAIEDAMRQIYQLTGQIGENVGQHNAQVQQINDELADASARGDDDLKGKLLATIAKITQANERLQGDLKSAEMKMAEQAAALESQMAMARTDALTGALNRRAFDDEFGRRVSEFQRYRTPVSLLLFDIDHFKKFNDTYGHQTGDEVLCHVSCTLQMVMRDVDLVCRYGGEEFAVILPATDIKGASLAAERARAAVERMIVETGDQQLKVTSSVGVATVLPDEDMAAVIARADQGLYASKKAGRNCVHIHDGEQLVRHGAGKAPESPAANKVVKSETISDDGLGDPLHLLPNLQAFTEEVRRRIDQHQRYHAPVTIVYGGIDGFNQIVAQHGRDSGNVVLRAVVQFIKGVLRDNEMLARVADDRLAFILGGVDAAETAAKMDRILGAVQKCRLPFESLKDLQFTASFGLAEIEPGNNVETLMQRGAAAFAAATAAGNCIQVESHAKCSRPQPVGA